MNLTTNLHSGMSQNLEGATQISWVNFRLLFRRPSLAAVIGRFHVVVVRTQVFLL